MVGRLGTLSTVPVAATDLGGVGSEAFPAEDEGETPFEETSLPNPELDDCSLVLTTSRGQVMTAPVVPATLEQRL